MASAMKLSKDSLRQDILASLVVFLVAVPLSIGIAAASGAPVRAGLIGAVVGGVVVGVLGGAPLQVSGPAAGLSVMVFGYVQQFGFAATCTVVVIAGLIQIFAGSMKWAELALAMPPAVIHAMLAGIGILIALGQFMVLLGGAPQGGAIANLRKLPEFLQHVNTAAAITGATTFAVMVIWNRFVAKRIPLVPAALVAVTVGTLVSLGLPTQNLVKVDGNLFGDMHMLPWSMSAAPRWALAALALAFVATAESLLSAVATDKLHSGKRANLNRELVAQGVGNTVSGLLGGLPVTGVIVRSSANISAGAKTKLSAILHGVWILVFVVAAAPLLNLMPKAALAGLLIHVGVKLVKLKDIKAAVRYEELLPYAITLAGVVFKDMLWGIGLGLGIATLQLLLRLFRQTSVAISNTEGQHEVEIRGPVNFGSIPTLNAKLTQVPPQQKIVLRVEPTALDFSGLDFLRSWAESYRKAGGDVSKPNLDALWTALNPKRVNPKSNQARA